MQITFPKINHTYNDTSQKTYSEFKLKPQLACDTVSFGSSKDLLKLTPKTIFSRIDSSIKDTILLTDTINNRKIRVFVKWDDGNNASMDNSQDTIATTSGKPALLKVNVSFTQIAN